MVVPVIKIATIALFALFITHFSAAEESSTGSHWHEDYAEAENCALNENKAVLLFFTGSDWCLWCQKLESEVLDESGIAEHLESLVVPVRLDFPQRRKLPPKRSRANAILKDKWRVETIPTVILYNPLTRKELWRHGYVQSTAKDYAEGIRKALADARELDNPLNGQ